MLPGRIAHEIKNPLTPIQLSAERLQRRFAKEINDESGVFKTCTDTIIRQVSDIGRMVDEFSAFARMPEPQMKAYDLSELVRQTVFLAGTAKNTLTIKTHLPQVMPEIVGDSRQVAQALTNIIKNAIESIEGRDDAADQSFGLIEVTINQPNTDFLDIIVADNGRGLPQAERSRLTEPYVTTRSKGTGLRPGPSSKKYWKIMAGALMLEDNEPSGARVILRLKLQPDTVLDLGRNVA